MDLFKRKKASNTHCHSMVPENHVSKKKKNTYTVTFDVLCSPELFDLCKETPLPIILINGTPQTINDDWLKAKEFPNPCASDMVKTHKIISKIMGPKISCQIIEYLDKETGSPVLQLYPKTMYVFNGYEENYMSHLNHASRRDLKKQIALRKRLISEFTARQQVQK